MLKKIYKGEFMKNGVKFIIAALLIIAGMMAFKTYQEGGFANAQGVNAPVEQDVEAH
jgi:predicted negative regulator of RcsB-dependent stress response